jgi:hypothetical protein
MATDNETAATSNPSASQADYSSASPGSPDPNGNKPDCPEGFDCIDRDWEVGDPIDAIDSSSTYPDWTTVRERYWQNRAATSGNEFSPQNRGLMEEGGAPMARVIVRNNRTGQLEERLVSKELHHIAGREITRPHSERNLQELWPWEHQMVDPRRRTGYDFVEFK